MTVSLKLTAGSVFASDYKVVRPLRTGGQGSIYVVEQISTSKQRALKLMLPELVAQPSSRKRFELEAKIAARIKSDHVVESIASGVDAASGTPWLAMELLEGQDLAAYVQKKRRVPPSEVLEIFSQLCHALGEAHKQGIVHRDLKPANIFLATARRRGVPFMVKVLDFGIARILAESQTQSSATTTGLGTPMWMAPEQTEPGGPIAPSTDVWALGLLAFRLLTGYLFWKAPYDPGASVMMLMAEAFMHPLPTASDRANHYKVRDRIPPGFDAWFAKCVARPMDQRWANAADAFAAIEPILLAAGDEASVPARDAVAREPAQTPAAAPAAASEAGASEASGEEVAAVAGATGPGERVSTAAGIGPQPTGPGRATWEGAPELAADAVRSATESTPPPETPNEAPTADQAPPVQTSARPAGPRGRTLFVAATIAGVLIGGVIFATQRGAHAPRAGGAGATAHAVLSAAPIPPAPTPAAEASAEPPEEDASAAEPAPSGAGNASGVVGGRRGPKLCKHAGAKCFSNEDCCDRACRKWICKVNAALADPYRPEGN